MNAVKVIFNACYTVHYVQRAGIVFCFPRLAKVEIQIAELLIAAVAIAVTYKLFAKLGSLNVLSLGKQPLNFFQGLAVFAVFNIISAVVIRS